VTQPGDLSAAIVRGLAHDGPYVLDAVISPDIAAPVPGFERESLTFGH
jgi:thiamine pyrophosphate-dependent acetolactate synthase large subunit-like protein